MFQEALMKLDECNEYTRARYVAFPLNRNYVYFTIEIMIDVLKYDTDEPEIAIRCRSSKTHEVLFLWSWEKFKERLEFMREWYADLMDDGIINREHKIDAWSNISDKDIKLKQEEEKGDIEERIKKLKKKVDKLTTEQNSTKEKVRQLLQAMMSKVTTPELKENLPAYL